MAKDKLDLLADAVKDMAAAMRDVSRAVDTQNIQWPQLVDALNSQFVLHNTKAEELGKFVVACTEENRKFRSEIWSKMWSLFEKVVIILAIMAGGSLVFRFLLGG